MKFLETVRRRRAIRSYARKLPGLLRRDYGIASFYTPAQINKTIERSGLNNRYSRHAISMFADRAGFNRYHETIGEPGDYDETRSEVAQTQFHGNVNFTVSEIMDAYVVSGDHGGGDGGHGAADGHGGADH